MRFVSFSACQVDTYADHAGDPEGGAVLTERIETSRQPHQFDRSRIQVASPPMVDGDENAAIVNAVQHREAIVVQKSLAQGLASRWPRPCGKANPSSPAP